MPKANLSFFPFYSIHCRSVYRNVPTKGSTGQQTGGSLGYFITVMCPGKVEAKRCRFYARMPLHRETICVSNGFGSSLNLTIHPGWPIEVLTTVPARYFEVSRSRPPSLCRFVRSVHDPANKFKCTNPLHDLNRYLFHILPAQVVFRQLTIN